MAVQQNGSSHKRNISPEDPQEVNTSVQRRCPFIRGIDPAARSGFPITTTDAVNVQEADPNASVLVDLSDAAPAIGNIGSACIETLPAYYRDKSKNPRTKTQESEVVALNTPDKLRRFLTVDLDFRRLNEIHSSLWMCGRPLNARPLHRQLVLGRTLVAAEQADLHMLYFSDIMMIKPLPAYILCKEFWDEHLTKEEELYKSACGLLVSYIWLIRSQIDFNLATSGDHHFLPAGLDWPAWRRITGEIITYIDMDTLEHLNKRFQFGELRLDRINNIYRLHPRYFFSYFVRGYLYGYNRYEPFLQRNMSWVLGLSVLLSLALSAMQVGTGIDILSKDDHFTRACYGFVVFTCVLTVAVLGFVVSMMGSIFLYNMFAAISHSTTEQNRRGTRAKSKENGEKQA